MGGRPGSGSALQGVKAVGRTGSGGEEGTGLLGWGWAHRLQGAREEPEAQLLPEKLLSGHTCQGTPVGGHGGHTCENIPVRAHLS